MSIALSGQTTKHINGGFFQFGKIAIGVYATSGVSVAPRLFGMGVLDDLDVRPTAGYYFVWDKDNSLLLAYTDDGVSGIPAEVANATDLSAIIPRYQAFASY